LLNWFSEIGIEELCVSTDASFSWSFEECVNAISLVTLFLAPCHESQTWSLGLLLILKLPQHLPWIWLSFCLLLSFSYIVIDLISYLLNNTCPSDSRFLFYLSDIMLMLPVTSFLLLNPNQQQFVFMAFFFLVHSQIKHNCCKALPHSLGIAFLFSIIEVSLKFFSLKIHVLGCVPHNKLK
jgi:hypothetical protein